MKKLILSVAFVVFCCIGANAQTKTLEETRKEVESVEKELVILNRILETRKKQIELMKAKIVELHKQAAKCDSELMILTEHTKQQRELIKTLVMAARP